ncbi:amidohydrolase family protein [Microbacterium sp. P26]|uniref:amidohydrolase family protein n=1 Tax=Microbacterium TaxID=33882 RepID=UPI00203BDDD0|nr:amidohydrolase family protein [Microbacterium sp. P26]MCM3502547.1 amidohydrolase family protein [Microbacterium sp. P26]
MRTLIRNVAAATVDDRLGDVPRTDILIEDGVIREIRPDISAADAEVIDGRDKIAIPGMVDTHRHTWQTALRGILADGNIPDYLRGIRLHMAPLYRADDMYAGNYVGALDALNSGITTIVDYCHNILDPDGAHAAVTGLRDAGIRALYAHGLTPITTNTWSQSRGGSAAGSDPAALATRARLATEIRERYFSSDDQLLRFGIAPQELAIAPVADVAAEFRLARELGARITFHANQVMVRQLFQDVEVLHAHGLLAEDLLLVHCTFNTPREWELLEGSGVTVSVCAETEMQMGMGYPAIAETTAHTPGPSLGIDCVSGNGGDMLSHARLVLQASRYRADEPEYAAMRAPQRMAWTTRDALRWATLNGARAAGVDHLVGSLTPGKRADIVLVDMSGISQVGWNREDPTGAVLSQGNAGCIDTVFVDGKVVKRDGALVHVDVRAATDALERSHEHLYAQMGGARSFIPQPPIDIPLYRERA